ncbi:DUF6247 family protein [Nocardia brasiliensis]|uniref:DUF6247 family protein n=1 Tax=Nocardia brasiliensis TaxID=37326 RepID=UPI00340A5BA2
MVTPALPGSSAPTAEPKALRAALSPELRAEFDREWDLVLEQAKKSHTPRRDSCTAEQMAAHSGHGEA